MVRKRGSVRQGVYEELLRRITTLELPPRAPISENELARELGVSRTPVRESLLKLRAEGLVKVYPQIGSFVTHVDPEQVRTAQFIREAIECTSLSYCPVEELTDEDFEPVLHTLTEQRAAMDSDDLSKFLKYDAQFHQELMTICGHERAWPAVVAARIHLDRARTLGLRIRPLGSLIDQHELIVEQLRAGQVDAAVDELRDHVRLVLADLDALVESTPEVFDSSDLRPVRRVVTTLEPVDPE
ncbi:MAG: GntR family transcriptional regulator [Brooklawnia sp.]|jgi:DNA-binding GntR family transcriptional regulator